MGWRSAAAARRAAKALGELPETHTFVRECTALRERVETSKNLELLECVYTPRFTTARERLVRIRELLATGASIAAVDGAGDTVLHHAARLRAADSGLLVRSLLEAGASRTAVNAAGERPLTVAARNPAQVTDVVEALWAQGANWALGLAASRGHWVTAARLVRLGASPAPAALARPIPREGGLVEFALRVAAATGAAAIVDAAFSDAPPGATQVRQALSAFCAHGGTAAMRARFGGPDAEKLVAELVYTIASSQILETLVREDWARFVREDLGLLRAALPAELASELGDDDQLTARLELDFRGAAFDASPPELRAKAPRADFGRSEEPPPAKRRARRSKAR